MPQNITVKHMQAICGLLNITELIHKIPNKA